jgi:hypothetical protein
MSLHVGGIYVGAPTDYGVHVDLWGESEDMRNHEHVPVVQVWFLAAQADGDVDAVAARFERYCALGCSSWRTLRMATARARRGSLGSGTWARYGR